MSTTPNQKDLLAKKSDLEGILKPDDNDVLHLPGVTITLAESGQFYLAGIDKKLLTLIGNTSGNAVTLDGDAGLTFTTSEGSSTITGITNSSGNSTSLAASQSMASAKQDKIVAGSNITIAQDGKTISATDTNELENLTDVNITTPTDGQGLVYNNTTQKWENGNVSSASSIDTLTDVNLTNLTNGQILKYNSTSQEWENTNESGGGGGSTVIPNPTGTPTDTLDTVSIDGTIYEIQGGGGGSSNGFVKLAEYSGSGKSYAAGDTITLSDDMTNYDMLVFATNMFMSSNVYGVPAAFVTVDDFKTRYTERFFTWYEDTTGYNDVNYVSDTSIYVLRVSNVGFHAVYGVKFGGSSGSGGVLKGLDYANAVTLTLPDHTGYDYTPTGYGVLMATSYGDAGSIVITSQNEDVKYLSFRDDTWTTSWIPVTKDETYHVNRGSSSTDFPSGSWFKFIPWLCEGSGGGGASAVSDLTDVNLTSLANGQILKYDSTSQKWINSDESGGGNLSYETVFSGSKSTSAWNSPLVFNEFDVTAYDIIRITAAHDGYSYTWLIDTSIIPLTGGNTLHIYGEVYCNRDDTKLQMYVSTGHALEVSKIESVISGGGGGSSVIPNPTGTPTDTLDTVSIDGTIYEIQGGGSGSGGKIDTLWTGSEAPTVNNPITVNLLNDLSNYEVIIIDFQQTNNPYKSSCAFHNVEVGSQYIATPYLSDGHLYCNIQILSNTSISLSGYSSQWGAAVTYTGIYGVKTGGGGGGSSADEVTLQEYNALTTAQKNDGTIRFIPESNIGYGLDIDFTNSTTYEESGMSHTVNNNEVQIIWYNTSNAIGFTIYPTVKIDVTDYDFISYDLTSTSSYSATYGDNPLRDLGVGLRATAPSAITLAPNMNYTVWNRYPVTDVGLTFTDERIDVSNLTGEYYLIIACAGWNAVVSNIVIGTEGGNPSQIKYMDNTYGLGESGEGYTEDILYSATSTTEAPATLTLSHAYTDYDMLIFNLWRSADGVMNKYDRFILTSQLNINDRIQLITYNEWASYDITTTTSFTLINENRMYIGSVVGLKFGEGGGSGGSSEVTYSTTEHKVGTWIDGSDVYEKTIVLRENGTDNFTYTSYVFEQSLPANIDWINIESFYAKRASGGWVDCMNNQQETILVPNPTTQGIYFYSRMSHTDVTVTIRYTKTT